MLVEVDNRNSPRLLDFDCVHTFIMFCCLMLSDVIQSSLPSAPTALTTWISRKWCAVFGRCSKTKLIMGAALIEDVEWMAMVTLNDVRQLEQNSGMDRFARGCRIWILPETDLISKNGGAGSNSDILFVKSCSLPNCDTILPTTSPAPTSPTEWRSR